MFSLEKLKKTSEALTKAAVNTVDGVKYASTKVFEGAIFTASKTLEVAEIAVVEPSVSVLRHVWPTIDAGTEPSRIQSSDNSNLALFRTCMDGGVDISHFYSALGIQNSGTTKSLNNILSVNTRERISQIFDGCASCRCICCGIFCCHKCKYKIIALSEALEVLTLPAARWEKECQTYFLKEALVYRRKICYDPDRRAVFKTHCSRATVYEVDWQRNCDGQSACHIAAYYGHKHIVKLLLDNRIGSWSTRLLDKGDSPYSPVDYAYMRGHHGLARAMNLFGNHNLLVHECCRLGLSKILLQAFGFYMKGDGSLIDKYRSCPHKRKVKLLNFNFQVYAEDAAQDVTQNIFIVNSGNCSRLLFDEHRSTTKFIAINSFYDRRSGTNIERGDVLLGYKKHQDYWIVSIDNKNHKSDISDDSRKVSYIRAPEIYLQPLDYIVDWVAPNTNAIISDGNTALHIAALHGNYIIVELLLMLGWSKYVKNKKGMTPGDAAKSNNHILLGEKIDAFKVYEKNIFDALQSPDNLNLVIKSLKEGRAISRNFCTRSFFIDDVVSKIRFGHYDASESERKHIIERILVKDAHHDVRNGKIRILAKRGTIFCARGVGVTKVGLEFYIYDDRKRIPVFLTKPIVPRYNLQWTDSSKMTVLDMAEEMVKKYTRKLEKMNSMSSALAPGNVMVDYENLCKTVKSLNSLLSLLYSKGWSHCESEDSRKNHNLLLIYALCNAEQCWTTVKYCLEQEVLIRYKPDFHTEGDSKRNFLYSHTEFDELNSSFKISCNIGMQKVLHTKNNMQTVLFVHQRFEPFRLKPSLKVAKSIPALQNGNYDGQMMRLDTNFLKLSARQPDMRYTPDYMWKDHNLPTRMPVTALDVINYKLALFQDNTCSGEETAQKASYEWMREKLIDRGWTDWKTAITMAENGLSEIESKLKLYENKVSVCKSDMISDLRKKIEAANRRKDRIICARSKLQNCKNRYAYSVINVLKYHGLQNVLKV